MALSVTRSQIMQLYMERFKPQRLTLVSRGVNKGGVDQITAWEHGFTLQRRLWASQLLIVLL